MKMLIITTFVMLFAISSMARPVSVWTYDELFEQADVVAIVHVSQIEMTAAQLEGHGDAKQYQGKRATAILGLSLKGQPEHTFQFDFFTYSSPTDILSNGAMFPDLSKAGKTHYLVFLKETPDGGLAPVGGHYDGNISICPVEANGLIRIENDPTKATSVRGETPVAASTAEEVWTLPRTGALRCISPDGRWLIYSGLFAEPRDYRDFLVDLKSGQEKQLSEMLSGVAKNEELRGIAFCPASAHQLLVKRKRTTGNAWDVLDVSSGKCKNLLPYREEGQFQRALWLGRKLVVSPQVFAKETVGLLTILDPNTGKTEKLSVAGFLMDAANDTVLVQGDTQAPTKPFIWKELRERPTYGLLAAHRSGRLTRTILFTMCGTPALSPDGRCIAVTLHFAKTPEKNGFYLFPADTERPGIRIEGIDRYFNIWALDDGRALVHMSRKQDKKSGDTYDLVFANPDGAVSTLARNVQSPVVVGSHVYFLPREGKTLRRLTIPPIDGEQPPP